MLVPIRDLAASYRKRKTNLETIVRLRAEAPPEFRVATDHFTSISKVFPYLYHTLLVEQTLTAAGCASARILDWGAFLGQVTYLLRARDQFEVDAYNPSQNELIDYWHGNFQIPRSLFAEPADLRAGRISCASGAYDAVVCSGVLEHTFEFGMDDLQALREIFRVLNDDGHLFIWHLPCANSLEERRARRPGVWRHILAYDLDQILIKLSLAGFQVVGIEKTGLVFDGLVGALGGFMDISRLWSLDLWLSGTRLLGPLAHDFTIVCRKQPGFPLKPAAGNYGFFVP